MDIPLIELEFGLNVRQEYIGIVLAFTNKNHDIDLFDFLTFEPHGYKDVEVR